MFKTVHNNPNKIINLLIFKLIIRCINAIYVAKVNNYGDNTKKFQLFFICSLKKLIDNIYGIKLIYNFT